MSREMCSHSCILNETNMPARDRPRKKEGVIERERERERKKAGERGGHREGDQYRPVQDPLGDIWPCSGPGPARECEPDPLSNQKL